jgi:hypothetical protein
MLFVDVNYTIMYKSDLWQFFDKNSWKLKVVIGSSCPWNKDSFDLSIGVEKQMGVNKN